jgi:hypothetical protein
MVFRWSDPEGTEGVVPEDHHDHTTATEALHLHNPAT